MKHPAVQLIAIMVILMMSIGFWMIIPSSNAETQNGASDTHHSSGSRAENEFSIEFIDTSVDLFPNKRDVIDAKLENKGTLEDTYVVDINQVPTKWTVTFDNEELSREYTLSPSGSHIITLIVDPPGSGSARITLKAKSKTTGDDLTAGIDLNVKQPIITMVPDVKEKTSMPSDTASFKLNLTNLQQVPENVTITLTGSDITPGDESKLNQWTYSITPSRLIVLAMNSSQILDLNIYTPTEPAPGLLGVFKIQARPDSDLDNPIEDTITVVVEELDLVEGKVAPALATGKPGEQVSFTVTLLNNGTGDQEDVSLFKGDLPAGWEVVYNTTRKYQLDRDEEKSVELGVKIPGFATVGVFKLKMIIQAKFGNPLGNFTMMVKVLQVVGVSIQNTDLGTDPVSGEPRYIVDWRLESDAALILKNSGNGRDSMKLNLSGVPPNWLVYFKIIEPVNGFALNNVTDVDFTQELDLTTIDDDKSKMFALMEKKTSVMNLILDPGQEVKLTLGINTTLNGKQIYNFTVSAFTSDVGISQSVLMDLRLIRSKLDITEIEPSLLVPRVDDTVLVTATIQNPFHVPTENITVTLRVSDLQVDQKQVQIIPAGKNVDVDFEWTPTRKGNYILEIVVEGPDVTSGNEPTRTKNITVEGKAPNGNGNEDSTAIYLVIGVIVVFTVLVLVLFLTSRDKIQLLMQRRRKEHQKKNNVDETNGEERVEPKPEAPPVERSGGRPAPPKRPGRPGPKGGGNMKRRK